MNKFVYPLPQKFHPLKLPSGWYVLHSGCILFTDGSCYLFVSYSGEYLGIYAVFGAAQSVLAICSSFCLAMAGIFASRLIHNRLLVNILRLPMSFFDTTPSGRILNRFSKDIYTIDEMIPKSLISFLFTFFAVINILVVVSYATPLFMVVILPLSVLYLLIQVTDM